MYAQFFGNYLLSRNAITTDQLVDAINAQRLAHMKLGTLALHAGYMTASEVDQIIIQQTHEDKLFGEIAIEDGYLSEAQVASLLQMQTPDFLLLGQILVEKGVLTNVDLENLMVDYKSENEIFELDMISEQKEKVSQLIRNFFTLTDREVPSHVIKYLNLLFNNLVRFIGEDFTPLNPSLCPEYATICCASQKLSGKFEAIAYLDMSQETAICFASRYVSDEFLSYDEYVQASLEDFLNLHNGLFNVNLSNDESIELTLEAPEILMDSVISNDSDTVLLPIIYPFGTINFLITL